MSRLDNTLRLMPETDDHYYDNGRGGTVKPIDKELPPLDFGGGYVAPSQPPINSGGGPLPPVNPGPPRPTPDPVIDYGNDNTASPIATAGFSIAMLTNIFKTYPQYAYPIAAITVASVGYSIIKQIKK